MDVVFRISEEKKQIKYSRSEARILEVLDDVCEQVPLELPGSNHKSKRMLSAACNDFVGEYEDELTRTFFDDFTPAKERFALNLIKRQSSRSSNGATPLSHRKISLERSEAEKIDPTRTKIGVVVASLAA
ncbi:hypothetical protein ON010_g4187 [Phytophthora cinnamomi]|nr:hypothetical protein ON010_g4187 [Phytophthora cinnamomi]